MLKKLLFINLIFIFIIFLSSCKKKEKLYVYSFQNDDIKEILETFKKEKNIDIISRTFSNPKEFIKSYDEKKTDILFLPNWLINYYKTLDIIEKIDQNKLSSKKDDKFIPHLANWIKKQNEALDYDILDYIAPSYFETFGILFNSSKIDITEVEKLNFNIAKEKIDPFTVSFLRDEMTNFSIYLLSLIKMNLTLDDYIKWYNFPKNLFNMHTRLTNISEYEKSDIILTYSSVAKNILKNKILTTDNTKMRYYIPKETGSLINFRGVSILKKTSKKSLAYDLINHIRKSNNQEIIESKYNYFSIYLNTFKSQIEKDKKYAGNPLYNEENKFLFKEILNIHNEGLSNGKIDNFFSFDNDFIDNLFDITRTNNLGFK